MQNKQKNPISSFQAGFVLVVLLLAYILSFIDRMVLNVLLEPIKQDFDISDFQVSLLIGPAFTFFYVILGIPIARLADTKSRKVVIGVGIFVWSIATCMCGMAKNFISLFVMRMAVGVGEAALSPPTHSLLSDLFSPKRLPVALAIYSLGISIGSGLAYIVGGKIFGLFVGLDNFSLPLLGQMSAWQVTFVVVGVPGFLVSFLMFFTREPDRKGVIAVDESATPTLKALPIKTVIAYLWSHRKLYGAPFMGISLLSILGYGMLSWYVAFMIRRFGADVSVIGPQFGLLLCVAGSIGTFGGGLFVGVLERMGYRDANFRIITITAIVWCIPAVAGPLMPTESLAFWAATPTLLLFNFYFGGAFAGLQLITPNQMRAQTSAILLFVANVFGLGLGPVIIAFFTDFVFADEAKLNYSLSMVALIVCPLAAYFSGRSLKYYRQALDEQDQSLKTEVSSV